MHRQTFLTTIARFLSDKRLMQICLEIINFLCACLHWMRSTMTRCQVVGSGLDVD